MVKGLPTIPCSGSSRCSSSLRSTSLLMIPLTYSISYGIGLGFIAYVVITLAERRFSEIHPLMYVAAVAFAVHLLWR